MDLRFRWNGVLYVPFRLILCHCALCILISFSFSFARRSHFETVWLSLIDVITLSNWIGFVNTKRPPTGWRGSRRWRDFRPSAEQGRTGIYVSVRIYINGMSGADTQGPTRMLYQSNPLTTSKSRSRHGFCGQPVLSLSLCDCLSLSLSFCLHLCRSCELCLFHTQATI